MGSRFARRTISSECQIISNIDKYHVYNDFLFFINEKDHHYY